MSEPGIDIAVTLPAIALGQLEEQIARSVLAQLEDTVSPWMNLETAAAYLDWPRKRLYNLVAANEIPHRKQRNRLLFHRAELDAWLNAHYQGPPELAP